MADKIGDNKKIGGVKSTESTKDVKGTEAVGGVAGVKATQSVGKVAGASAAGMRRSTRVMTLQEREQLLRIIEEEAEAVLGKTGIGKEQRKVVKEAVKMAVDAGLLEPSDEDEGEDEEESPKK